MKTKEQYFEEYSALCQFEEGSPEYLIDKEDFLKCMEEHANSMYNQALEDVLSKIHHEYIDKPNETGSYNFVFEEDVLKLKK